jgi:hypothetical protein
MLGLKIGLKKSLATGNLPANEALRQIATRDV